MKRWMVQEPVSQDVQRQFPELDDVILQLLWNQGLKTQEDGCFWDQIGAGTRLVPELFYT